MNEQSPISVPDNSPFKSVFYFPSKRGRGKGTSLHLRGLWAPAALLWVFLWLNLNSGPWNISEREWPWGYINSLRACLPFLVAALALPFGVFDVRDSWKSERQSLFYLTLYSCVALLGSLFSTDPSLSLYFGLVHLLTILVWKGLINSSSGRDPECLWFAANIAIATLYAVAVIYVGRSIIFGGGETAYGILGEIEEVAGMPMSRSSGVARFAAIPAIVALGLCCCDRRYWRRLLWLGTFCVFSYVVYRMQSRGSLFAAVAALIFVVLAASGRKRWLAICLLVVGSFILLSSNTWSQVAEYLSRGQDAEEFRSFTGRSRAWENALHAFWVSPIIGSGNFADRLLIEEHVHNAFLQALLFGGIAGVVPYILSWIWSWKNLMHFYRVQEHLASRERTMFIVAGGLLVFFSVRSFPETTSASFSVDLLVMVPVMAYLDLAPRLCACTAPKKIAKRRGGRAPKRRARARLRQLIAGRFDNAQPAQVVSSPGENETPAGRITLGAGKAE